MKRYLSWLISVSMLLSLLSGCSSKHQTTPIPEIAYPPSTPTIGTSTPQETHEEIESGVVSTLAHDEDNISQNPTPSETYSFDWDDEIKFTGISDDNLLQYVEDSVYTQLIDDLDSTEYFIENVSAVYMSQEYLRELAYNSRTNVFFGYSLSELDEYYKGTRYVFTHDADGRTIVKPVERVEDTTYDQIIKNVAVGTGVILVCVTVSTVTAGIGATAAAVNMIFAVAAKTGAACALSGTAISGVTSAAIRGYQTGDLSEALRAGALGASEGYKWGAISGALTGGASEAFGLYSATGNGLTMNQVAQIQKESHYPLSIIKQFHSMDEYNVFRNAGLQAEMLAGKLTLVRSNDIDLYHVVDEYGRNNFYRLSHGMNPIDGAGHTFEWHHIGQTNDATLALLTSAEHDSKALHGFKVVSEIDRDAFADFKKVLNKALLKWLRSSTQMQVA